MDRVDEQRVSDEELRVVEWHTERLVELGVTDNADLNDLAAVDWHALERLIAAGCPLPVAVDILR
jgi:predicted component of type VI protein secretion system